MCLYRTVVASNITIPRILYQLEALTITTIASRSLLIALFLLTDFDQGCRGKWIVKQKLEHAVIVLKSVFDASPALGTVTHPQPYHCVVP